MATGGEVPGRLPGSAASEHLSQRICQPCLEKDNLRDATGLCVDCQDYLCLKCSDDHKVRQHRVLDREQRLHGQTQAKPEDACPVHENEVIQYYCASHCQLGCKLCIQLDHETCDEVHYIPRVSKDLFNNEDYRQVETQLKSVLDTFINVFRNALQRSDEVEKSCEKALREIRDFKRQMDEALEKVECNLTENVQTLRLKAEQELAEMSNKYKAAHKELQSSLANIEFLQNDNQNCSSYIEMMRTKAKIKSLEDQTQEAVVDTSRRQRPIQFYPNEDLFELLKNPDCFGTVSSAGTRNVLSWSDEVPELHNADRRSVSSWSDDFSVITDTESMISQPRLRTGTLLSQSDTGDILSRSTFGTQDYHLQELYVKTERDKVCRITGMVVLPNNRLMLIEHTTSSIRAVDVHTGQVVARLELKSRPWDITSIERNEFAVTKPYEKQIEILTFAGDNLKIGRKLTVGGPCFGVDYKNGKFAVSFIDSYKVKILNLKGRVLYSIKANTSGASIFDYPCYLTFGQDDSTLYVSSFYGNYVVCVTMDGTVVPTYTDRDLRNPKKAVVDSSGNVYVCAYDSNTVLQITKDCNKLQVLLTEADGLDRPWSICLSEEEDKLYVGMGHSDYVNVYRTDRHEPQ